MFPKQPSSQRILPWQKGHFVHTILVSVSVNEDPFKFEKHKLKVKIPMQLKNLK